MTQKKKMNKRIEVAVKALDDIMDLAKKNPTLARILKEAKIEHVDKGWYTVEYTVHDKSYEVVV